MTQRIRASADAGATTRTSGLRLSIPRLSADLSETYGGRGAELVNSVTLNNKENDGTGFKAVAKSRSSDDVPIPGVFTKKLTGKPEEDNGLIAEYTITVNEAMADLSKLKELAITDAMSKTLNLIPSSLKIQYEGKMG